MRESEYGSSSTATRRAGRCEMRPAAVSVVGGRDIYPEQNIESTGRTACIRVRKFQNSRDTAMVAAGTAESVYGALLTILRLHQTVTRPHLEHRAMRVHLPSCTAFPCPTTTSRGCQPWDASTRAVPTDEPIASSSSLEQGVEIIDMSLDSSRAEYSK